MKRLFILILCSFILIGCKKKGCTDRSAINFDQNAKKDDGSCQFLPILSTIPLIATANGIETGGVISSDGGSDITLRGVCWSNNPNPTIYNDTTIDGGGSGNYESLIRFLIIEPNNTYYVRAYATSSNGTGYGEQYSINSNIYGCTDPVAINYNPNATIDDGSCQYSLIDTIYLNSNISRFVLNEVLYDPASGTDGDANNDGIRDPNEDEFVEFVNVSDSVINISHCRIFDETSFISLTPRHKFPSNTYVNSNQAVVVFGGPQGATFNPSSFGNALLFAASEAVMNLNNSGDKMYLTDSLNNIIIEFDINPLSNNPNESYTRNPDLTGNFELHSGVSGTLFSPGTRADGSLF